jgi:hypothetical protein
MIIVISIPKVMTISKLEIIFYCFKVEDNFVNALIQFIWAGKLEIIFCGFMVENNFVNALIRFIKAGVRGDDII